MPVKKDPARFLGHRDRLRKKFLEDKATSSELLELALAFMIPRCDVKEVARALEREIGSTLQILCAPHEKLAAVQGMGNHTATFIKVIQKLMTTGLREYLMKNPAFYDDEQFKNYCRMILGCRTTEEVHVLYMDSRLCMLADEVHSIGTPKDSPIFPSEIVRRAAQLNSTCVAIIHNHPTPLMSFSREDEKLTKDLYVLLGQMNITLYDHCVVSGGTVYSSRDLHILDSK